jgi:hypothetical protein
VGVTHRGDTAPLIPQVSDIKDEVSPIDAEEARTRCSWDPASLVGENLSAKRGGYETERRTCLRRGIVLGTTLVKADTSSSGRAWRSWPGQPCAHCKPAPVPSRPSRSPDRPSRRLEKSSFQVPAGVTSLHVVAVSPQQGAAVHHCPARASSSPLFVRRPADVAHSGSPRNFSPKGRREPRGDLSSRPPYRLRRKEGASG